MNVAVMSEPEVVTDPIEEMRLRTWARQNYMPRELRDHSWHPIILEEMQNKDRELSRH